MDTFKKIATVLGVAVIGYFGFYLLVIAYNVIAFLFCTPNNEHQVMATITAIIAVVIYLVKSRRQ